MPARHFCSEVYDVKNESEGKMKTNKYDQSTFLVLKTAYLYYICEKPQGEIAEELGISVTTVSRLLKKAKEEKIIEFVIRDPLVKCVEMEKELKERLNVKQVIIAPAVSLENETDMREDPENVKKLVALEAARYLQRTIKSGDVVGFTWGSTVYQMINYLNPAQKVEAEFVSLHGSLANSVPEWDVRTLVDRIAKAFSGRKHTLLTHTLMRSKETVELLKQEKNIADVYQMFDKVNIAVNGIGVFYPKTTTVLARPDYLPPEDLKELKAKGVVGDIAIRFFDRNGMECDTSLKDRTLSIDFEKFRSIDEKITLASGEDKAFAVLSAVRGGLIDTLIIDSNLGAGILDLAADNK